MNTKTLVTVILILFVVIIGAYALMGSEKRLDDSALNATSPSITSTTSTTTNTPIASIEGCYVSTLAKDVYTLTIENESNGQVNGKLSFKNFEKDSSSGPIVGTYRNGIILADYSFASEGMNSVRQVIFKKTGDDFIEGFGPVTVEGNKEVFTDINEVSYDSGILFKKAICN